MSSLRTLSARSLTAGQQTGWRKPSARSQTVRQQPTPRKPSVRSPPSEASSDEPSFALLTRRPLCGISDGRGCVGYWPAETTTRCASAPRPFNPPRRQHRDGGPHASPASGRTRAPLPRAHWRGTEAAPARADRGKSSQRTLVALGPTPRKKLDQKLPLAPHFGRRSRSYPSNPSSNLNVPLRWTTSPSTSMNESSLMSTIISTWTALSLPVSPSGRHAS